VAVPGGNVYGADTDNHVIRQISLSSPVTTSTVAGTAGSSGTTDDTGSAARFNEPRGIATDGTYLYVTDFGNHTIRRIEIGTWIVTTIAGQAGTPGSTDATGTSAQFNYPRGLAVSGGIAYVADTDNHTIRRIDLSSGAVTTIAGQAGSAAHTDATGSAARFDSPRGIAVDAQSLYVADFANHVIRQVLIGSWDVSTLCGSGSMGTADGTGTAASLHGPWGIAFDPLLGEPAQVLYVAETGNSALRSVE
jgi:sugar lactone lactonase YvrE